MKKNQVFPLLVLLAIIAGVSSLIFLYSRAHAGPNDCTDRTYPGGLIQIVRAWQREDEHNLWTNYKAKLPGSLIPANDWDCVAMSWQDRIDLWEGPSYPVGNYVWTRIFLGEWYVYGYWPAHSIDPNNPWDYDRSDMDVDVVCFHKDIADFNVNPDGLPGLAGKGLFDPDPSCIECGYNWVCQDSC